MVFEADENSLSHGTLVPISSVLAILYSPGRLEYRLPFTYLENARGNNICRVVSTNGNLLSTNLLAKKLSTLSTIVDKLETLVHTL